MVLRHEAAALALDPAAVVLAVFGAYFCAVDELQRGYGTVVAVREVGYVLSTLLAPVGFVVQDVVADAMTVEAVPKVDQDGQPFPADTKRLMHTTMQTLGRVAIIGGTVFVALLNVFMFAGVENLDEQAKLHIYIRIYEIALVIPVISVAGVLLRHAQAARTPAAARSWHRPR